LILINYHELLFKILRKNSNKQEKVWKEKEKQGEIFLEGGSLEKFFSQDHKNHHYTNSYTIYGTEIYKTQFYFLILFDTF